MQYILGILLAGIILLFGIGYYNHSAAERRMAEARAYRIERMADAQAAALTYAAITPVVIVGIGGIVAIMSIALVIFGIGMVWTARIENKPKVIERQQIVYVLPPGTQRREYWKLLSGDSKPVLIEHHD